MELFGTATSVALVDLQERSARKIRSAVRFDDVPGQYPVRSFGDEGELATYLEGQSAAFRVTVGRIRAPRVRVNHICWPPSERVAWRMKQLEKFHRAGRIGMDPENLRGVEGTDLRTIWKLIVPGYPALEYLLKREDDRS